MITWKKLSTEEELENIKKESETHPVLIFKHSTRCSISSTAKDRLERNWNDKDAAGLTSYYLDLIEFRDISNKIAKEFNVEHQSPQVILIRNGKAVYDNSHMAINFQEITKQLH